MQKGTMSAMNKTAHLDHNASSTQIVYRYNKERKSLVIIQKLLADPRFQSAAKLHPRLERNA
jgi:hypothetical protein